MEKAQKKNVKDYLSGSDGLENALDRIAGAENVDDQVEKEIQQYWVNRIEEAEKSNPAEAARLRRLMEFLEITG